MAATSILNKWHIGVRIQRLWEHRRSRIMNWSSEALRLLCLASTSVPVLIWELDERDLPTLNRYEGYPRLYRQEKMSFDLDGKEVLGMAYLMNYGELSPPSQQYYNTILQGYRENGLDEKYLQTALENSLFLEHSVNDELYEDEFEDYDLDDDMQMRF